MASNSMKKESKESVDLKDDLRFINESFAFGTNGITDLNTGEPLKKNKSYLFMTKAFKALMQPYVSSGVKFRGSLVRLINALYAEREYTRLSLNEDVEACINNRVEIMAKELRSENETLQKRINELESQVSTSEATLKQLDSVTRGLEGILSQSKRGPYSSLDSNEESKDTKSPIDYSYLLLENRYRGSEEEISSRMQPYAERIINFLGDTGGDVLEIGCGRGELMSLLKHSGVSIKGLEMDDAMVESCAAKGLETQKGDALSYLKKQNDSSLAGVIAIQVVEHLGYEYRLELFSTIRQKVRPGGFVIFETINTSAFLPLLQNYFRDPTHTAPLHPDTLRTLLEQSGLIVKELVFSSDYPEEAKIPLLPSANGMPFRHQELIRHLNERYMMLNNLIYGPQDYAVIAEVPSNLQH